jgi:hypothetical protein
VFEKGVRNPQIIFFLNLLGSIWQNPLLLKNKTIKIGLKVRLSNNPFGQNLFTKILANQTGLYQVTQF